MTIICPSDDVITIDDALHLVRSIQDKVMASGYYLALAGGCLNKGVSTNDIDLVAVPRDSTSDHCNLYLALHTAGWLVSRSITHNSRGRNLDIAHYTVGGLQVDVAIVGR